MTRDEWNDEYDRIVELNYSLYGRPEDEEMTEIAAMENAGVLDLPLDGELTRGFLDKFENSLEALINKG